MKTPPNTIAAKPALPDVPIEHWLSAKAVGSEFGVNEDTILRWWSRGLPTGQRIPGEYHRQHGHHRHLFHAQIVSFIREQQALLDQRAAEVPALPEVPIEQWLSAKTVAADFFGTECMVTSYRRSGLIPAAFVRKL